MSGRKPPKGLDPGSVQKSAEEAMNRPLDFPAQERAAQVRAMVARTEEQLAQGRSAEEIRELLPEFFRDYKFLFHVITQPEGQDKSQLATMLAMLDRIGSGSMNTHQASVIVGDRLLKKQGPQGGSNPQGGSPSQDSS